MKQFLIAGNWKMNTVLTEASVLARAIVNRVESSSLPPQVRVVICPPFTSLEAARREIDGTSIALGAQNCSHEKSGAFTGEVSAAMLHSAGCSYVILGHSERRRYFQESNDLIYRKVSMALQEGLVPILCVGETLEEREQDRTFEIIEEQIKASVFPLDARSAEQLVIAYEPVWAIGTGRAATAEQAQEVHAFLRTLLAEHYSDDRNILLLYGGSMTAENAQSLLSQPDIHGGLIGGASLKAESFCGIIEAACTLV